MSKLKDKETMEALDKLRPDLKEKLITLILSRTNSISAYMWGKSTTDASVYQGLAIRILDIAIDVFEVMRKESHEND